MFLILFFHSLVASVLVQSEFGFSTRNSKDFEMRPQERTAPVIVGDAIYVANLEGYVMAIHRYKGYILWKTKLENGVDGALSFARSKIFVGDTDGILYALWARDGSIAWRKKITSEWLGPFGFYRDRVFGATSSNEFYAFDERTGKELDHYLRRGDEKMTVRGVAGAVVNGSQVFQGFSDGTLVSLSISDFKKEGWTKSLKQKGRFYDVDMAPYIDTESVIVGSYDGNIYNLKRDSGEIRWVYPVGSYAGFLVHESKVYFSGLNNKIYALDKNLGTVIWETAIEQGVGLTPQKVGEYLVVTTSSDPVYMLNLSDGKVVWSKNLGTGTLVSVVTDNEDRFYCLTNYSNFWGFRVYKAQPFRDVVTLPSFSALFRSG